MPGIIPSVNTCCDPCTEPLTVAVAGSAGVSAFTTASSFTMPAQLANVTVTVGNSTWMAISQVVFVSDGTNIGYFEVQSKPSSTGVILKNLESGSAYSVNAAPGAVFAAAATVSPAGLQAGTNAFSTANSFVMPAELANVTVTTTSSEWMGIGQVVFAAGGGFSGYFQVISKADATHAVLRNLEDTANSAYAANSAPGTIFPALTTLQPGGIQGAAGTTPAGAALIANNLGDVGFTPGTMRTNLGLGTAAVVATTSLFQVANNLSEGTAATMRTNLGLGTMATQAASAVAITGGALNGTLGATTATTAAVTTLSSTGTTTASGRRVQTPSVLQSLLAATAISADAEKIRAVGNGGAVTLTGTPTISAGTADGQRLLIKGTSATLTVTLQDESALAGTTLELGAATRALGLNSQIELSWDAATSKWCEISYSANT